MKDVRDVLAAIDGDKLSPDDALDLKILLNQVNILLFTGIDLATWRNQPDFYEDLFSITEYLESPRMFDRNGPESSGEERARRAVAHERAALKEIPHVLENLRGPMSRQIVERAITSLHENAATLRMLVGRYSRRVKDSNLRAEFIQTSEQLAIEVSSIAEHLRKIELPRSNDSPVLGRENFEKMLQAQESLAMPLADFTKMGEDQLRLDKADFERLKKKVTFRRPKPSEVWTLAETIVEAAHAFVEEKGLVTIPPDPPTTFPRPLPPGSPYFAQFDGPGPFDVNAAGWYSITVPDPSATKVQQVSSLVPIAVFRSTLVHEVYPGHFLQSQWLRKAPTRIQKVFTSVSFTEGWAHYGEQLMIEEGFGVDNLENKLGQISDALLRDCRLIVSVGVHTSGMTLKEAERRFREDCYQEPTRARMEALRAIWDPSYFGYALGKIQILRLREEVRAKLGDRFTLKEFHDSLLSHGAPPIPLIQQRVLQDLTRNGE